MKQKLKKLLKEYKKTIQENAVPGTFSAVNSGAIAGLHPPDTHPKQVMSGLFRRKEKNRRKK